jgi:hypothetical protein
MIPFRVVSKADRSFWIVLNYQPGASSGQYLIAREIDTETDGEIRIIDAARMTDFRMVDFLSD